MVQTILTLRQIQTTKPIEETYFTVYPNPASDKIVVLRKKQLEVSNRIIVSNTLGQIIYQSTFDVNSGMHLINTTNWNKGVYNMQISSEIDPVYNFKFFNYQIKQKLL